MSTTVWDNALAAARHQEPDTVPVVLQIYSLNLKRYGLVKEYDYYHDLKLQLEAKVAFQRRFPEVLMTNALPEYGHELSLTATGFGGKVRWMDDAPPWVGEYPIQSVEDVDRLIEAGVPDPRVDGTASEYLKQLEYFCDWFPRDLREEYGYVDGNVYPGTCVEGAALAMGYDRFMVWMRRHPNTLHRWLSLATDFQLKVCEAIEEVVGPCRILGIGDHIASMMGREQFREFVLPYLNKTFERYPRALRWWHNEGSVSHMLDEVDKINADVWHFGYKDDPALCKQKTHFCLQGNIHPPLFREYTPQQVREECWKIMAKASHGGGLWLSTGGGLAPETPFRNIEAMIEATKTKIA